MESVHLNASCNVSNSLMFCYLLYCTCSDWSNCTANAQTAGCTYHDMFTEALQYPSWSEFNDYNLTQQRYREATDSLSHLCNNTQPSMLLSTKTRHFGLTYLNNNSHIWNRARY